MIVDKNEAGIRIIAFVGQLPFKTMQYAHLHLKQFHSIS